MAKQSQSKSFEQTLSLIRFGHSLRYENAIAFGKGGCLYEALRFVDQGKARITSENKIVSTSLENTIGEDIPKKLATIRRDIEDRVVRKYLEDHIGPRLPLFEQACLYAAVERTDAIEALRSSREVQDAELRKNQIFSLANQDESTVTKMLHERMRIYGEIIEILVVLGVKERVDEAVLQYDKLGVVESFLFSHVSRSLLPVGTDYSDMDRWIDEPNPKFYKVAVVQKNSYMEREGRNSRYYTPNYYRRIWTWEEKLHELKESAKEEIGGYRRSIANMKKQSLADRIKE